MHVLEQSYGDAHLGDTSVSSEGVPSRNGCTSHDLTPQFRQHIQVLAAGSTDPPRKDSILTERKGDYSPPPGWVQGLSPWGRLPDRQPWIALMHNPHLTSWMTGSRIQSRQGKTQ